MRGFNPAHAQRYADGGVVQSVKRMFGMDAEQNARVAEYRAQAAREKAAAASAAAPAAPASAPAKAITDYSSGGAMKRREEAAGLANGGMIRGPGTGTSDDIDATLPVGSYIMPADSTKTIGHQALEGMGRGFNPEKAKKVPVKVSNGEFNLSPEKVHAIGIETLEGMKEATHTPTGRGFRSTDIKPDDSNRAFFADGGVVDEQERLRRQTEMYVRGAQEAAATQPAAAPVAPLADRVAQIPTGGMRAPAPTAPTPGVLQTDPQARADREAISGVASSVADSLGNAGRAVADVAALPVRAVAGAVDSTAIRGLRAAGVNAPYLSPSLVPTGVDPSSMTPFSDQKRMQGAPAAAPAVAPATAPAAAVAAPGAVPPAAAPAGAPPQGTTADSLPSAPVAVTPGPGAVQVAAGVFRSGNSYGDSAQAATTGPRGFTGQPSPQNTAATENLATPRGFNPTAAAAVATPNVAAPVARSSANDWAARNALRNQAVSASSITNNGGRFDQTGGNNPDQAAYRAGLAADAAAQGAQPGLDRAAMEQNAALQRETIQQQGGIARENIQQGGANARAAQGFSLDRARAASENSARDVTTQGAQQIQQLRNVLLDPKATPEQRKQAETSLRAVSGKADAANRFTVVPGGQEVSPQGVAFTRPSQVIDNQTGQFIQQGAAAAPQYEVGRVYTDASGKKAKWDGKAWVPA